MNYSFDFMYDSISILKDKSQYDGKFFTCVKTTKIFCLPSCKARTLLKKNVEFVTTSEQAVEKGYRPCKRCYPLNSPGFFPDWLETIEQFLAENLHRKVSDIELAELVDLDISTIRRFFKKKHNQSIKEYHLFIRLTEAKRCINKGMKVESVASLVGYSTIKGFKLAFKKQFGETNFEAI